ncbi:MAG: 50S ribosomal protein L5, partial [Proteobacteria bacterium]|nr:50S ribosomal protein L5 [Pseudomonadota bacterium]
MARLRERYTKEIIPEMTKAFGYGNVMQVPRLEKVVVNVGAGEAKDNAKLMDQLVDDLGNITGQRPVVTKAKKSIANFHLREGQPVGCKVTLRGERMYE